MADLVKAAVVMVTYLPPSSAQLTGLVAGEAIGIGDACYVKSDGAVWRSTGAAANAAAKVRGFASQAAAVSTPVSLYWDVIFTYSSGLTPGTDYYLSGATLGALADAPSTGGTLPVAYAVNSTDIAVKRSGY